MVENEELTKCLKDTLRKMEKYEEEDIEKLENISKSDMKKAMSSCELKMSINIGISTLIDGTISNKERRIEKTLQLMRDIGLHNLEFELKSNGNIAKDSKRILKRAKEFNVEVSFHCPYYMNLINDEFRIDRYGVEMEEKMSEFSKKILLNAMRSAHESGVKRVVFHIGAYGDLKYEKDVALLKAVKEIQEVLDKAKEEGIEDVVLSPETTGKRSLVGSLEEVVTIHELIPEIEPTIDVAHIYAREKGKINFQQVFEELKNAKIGEFHFTPVTITKKGEIRHESLFSMKKPDFKEMISAMIENNISGVIINETPRNIEEAIIEKAMIEKLIDKKLKIMK